MAAPKEAGADPVVIACAADQAYVRPLAAMLQSVMENLGAHRSADVYILYSGITHDERVLVTQRWPQGRSRVNWVQVDESQFDGLPLWGRMPVATYFKLALPDMIPASLPRAIWLDCDILVLGDIGQMWDTDLVGAHIGAVRDAIVPFVSSRCGVARYRELGLKPDAPYFNAGVMSVDLTLWRRDAVHHRAAEYLRLSQSSVTFWDQEGLNATLAGKWKELEPRWNHNASVPPIDRDAAPPPSIIHFAGNLKPWRFLSTHPMRAQYYRYLDRTAFAGARPEPGITSSLISMYEASGLRSILYPAENVGMRLVRALSRR